MSMPAVFDKLHYLVGDSNCLGNMPRQKALPFFSEEAVDFLGALSKTIFADKKAREYKDVMAYAYWIRNASLRQAALVHQDDKRRIGRGVVFHIAPSNVPVNFAVSMTSAMLAGNASIIRVSDKAFAQVTIICDAINKLLGSTHSHLKGYICILRYEHNEEITQALTNFCDVRVVWGGNQTIHAIRQAALPPRAIEMTFADRHSLAVIDADSYLLADAKQVAEHFYTDTYYIDQNACSSPRLVAWLGRETEAARQRFWKTLAEKVKDEYIFQPIQAIDKYTAFARLGMAQEGITLLAEDNRLFRLPVTNLTADLMDYKEGGGFFFEYVLKDLEELLPIMGKSCQTVAYLGNLAEQLEQLVITNGVRGVDRIVPIGETMDLTFFWDGFDMIKTMSRILDRTVEKGRKADE